MHQYLLLVLGALAVLVAGCSPPVGGVDPQPASYAGTFVGYSWQGEVRGVALADANQYIETILTLDEQGIITDAKMRFFVKVDGYWTTRQSGAAYVSVNYAVAPSAAVPGESYARGTSMFTVSTVDMMSFYAVGVNADSTVALAVVCPITRYQMEVKLPPGSDYEAPVGDFTIGSGRLVPTIRTSSSGLIRPASWAELADNHLLNISPWSHVINDLGVLEGISADSSIRSMLEALGVEFIGDQPQPLAVTYGYFGLGGWQGNYDAIAAFLIGRDAKRLTSMIDWSIPRYAGAINQQNQFGIDVPSGATRTVQDSFDGLSGATVRVSRESTSYQRALVAAGILEESDVIIGRF